MFSSQIFCSFPGPPITFCLIAGFAWNFSNHVATSLRMPQGGATGDDYLFSAAATDDGGVVVGGYSNGTYNGVISEGLVDFIAIKLGAHIRGAFWRAA